MRDADHHRRPASPTRSPTGPARQAHAAEHRRPPRHRPHPASATASTWRKRSSTAPPPAASPTIAQFFGTARVPAIRARLARGLLRAMALERVLLARAARGRDLVFYKPRDAAPPRRATGPARQPAAARRTARRRRARSAAPTRTKPPIPTHLPTLAQLEAEIRRRPIGRALADICARPRHLPQPVRAAISGSRSPARIMWYRGNLPRLMKEFRRREVRFCDTEADRNPALGWPEPTRDGIRRMLGFFIGEPPVTPFPAARAAPAAGTRSPARPDTARPRPSRPHRSSSAPGPAAGGLPGRAGQRLRPPVLPRPGNTTPPRKPPGRHSPPPARHAARPPPPPTGWRRAGRGAASAAATAAAGSPRRSSCGSRC